MVPTNPSTVACETRELFSSPAELHKRALSNAVKSLNVVVDSNVKDNMEKHTAQEMNTWLPDGIIAARIEFVNRVLETSATFRLQAWGNLPVLNHVCEREFNTPAFFLCMSLLF